jgi:hypothetical protein
MSVRLPVVIVENHDGGHHTARHHEHDAVEVGPCIHNHDSSSVDLAEGHLNFCVMCILKNNIDVFSSS